jgi:hypothetical protein
MRTIKISVLSLSFALLSQVAMAAGTNISAGLELKSTPPIAAGAGFLIVGGWHYPVEQLDGLEVAMVPGEPYLHERG